MRGGYPGQNGPLLTAPSGRKFYRHSSNMGSVMVYNEKSVEKRMLVADAAYRADALALSFETNYAYSIPLPVFKMIPKETDGYFVGNGATTTGCKEVTDAQLDALFGDTGDTGTAKGNTDAIIVGCGEPKATRHCRSKIIDGAGCDLPMIQQLVRIYCDADFIDSLDPTVASQPSLRLTGWPFTQHGLARSSTLYSGYDSWCVRAHGYCFYAANRASYGVIPILEL